MKNLGSIINSRPDRIFWARIRALVFAAVLLFWVVIIVSLVKK